MSGVHALSSNSNIVLCMSCIRNITKHQFSLLDEDPNILLEALKMIHYGYVRDCMLCQLFFTCTSDTFPCEEIPQIVSLFAIASIYKKINRHMPVQNTRRANRVISKDQLIQHFTSGANKFVLYQDQII